MRQHWARSLCCSSLASVGQRLGTLSIDFGTADGEALLSSVALSNACSLVICSCGLLAHVCELPPHGVQPFCQCMQLLLGSGTAALQSACRAFEQGRLKEVSPDFIGRLLSTQAAAVAQTLLIADGAGEVGLTAFATECAQPRPLLSWLSAVVQALEIVKPRVPASGKWRVWAGQPWAAGGCASLCVQWSAWRCACFAPVLHPCQMLYCVLARGNPVRRRCSLRAPCCSLGARMHRWRCDESPWPDVLIKEF